MKDILVFLALALSLPALAEMTAESPVVVGDAYFRATPPGQSRTAGYFILHNRSRVDCDFMGADSPRASALEIHEHRHSDGMMKMRRVDSLHLAAGATLRFKPGGYHLMAFGVSAPFQSGTAVPVTLDFGPCGMAQVEFAVRGFGGD